MKRRKDVTNTDDVFFSFDCDRCVAQCSCCRRRRGRSAAKPARARGRRGDFQTLAERERDAKRILARCLAARVQVELRTLFSWQRCDPSLSHRRCAVLPRFGHRCPFSFFGCASTAHASLPSAFVDFKHLSPMPILVGIARLRATDQPDKDCSAEGEGFCRSIVDVLSGNPAVERKLALSSQKWGLNLAQWSVRDVVVVRLAFVSRWSLLAGCCSHHESLLPTHLMSHGRRKMKANLCQYCH